MSETKKLLPLLMEIGFLAADHAKGGEALKIFRAVEAVAETKEYPRIGAGYALIANGKFDEAIAVLNEQVLKEHPENAIAKAYIGLALRAKGMFKESDELLKAVIDDNKDEHGTSLAKAILEDMPAP